MKPVLAGLAAVLVLATASGCSAVTAAFVPQMKVGECATAFSSASEVDKIPKVACDQPHLWEAYAVKTLDGQAYPAEADLSKQADDFCSTEFEKFVGVAYDDSTYELYSLSPTKNSWALGDREILCLVGAEAGGITGSLKGVKK